MKTQQPSARRTTRQIQIVHQIVRQSHSHPSADEVYLQAVNLLPHISLGTVYRNLERLVEEGKINVFFLDDRRARYDPTTDHHAHFICQECDHVEDVFLNQLDQEIFRYLTILTRSHHKIFSYGLVLHGLCSTCSTKAPSEMQKSRPNKD